MPKYVWFYTWYEGHAHPPGLLRPNGFGLFDMLGNVRELCQERYQFNYSSHETGERIEGIETKRQDPDFGRYPASRGGSFVHHPDKIRAAFRIKEPRFAHLPDTSFRIVKTMRTNTKP